MFLYNLVIQGYWKQHELWDGTYVLTDVIDLLEALGIKAETERIVYEYEKEKNPVGAEAAQGLNMLRKTFKR